ncbi:MAG: hypothetical protein ABH886_01500 [Candidatus Desantisbacteria bacterium]
MVRKMLNNKYCIMMLFAFLTLSVLASSGVCEEGGMKIWTR